MLDPQNPTALRYASTVVVRLLRVRFFAPLPPPIHLQSLLLYIEDEEDGVPIPERVGDDIPVLVTTTASHVNDLVSILSQSASPASLMTSARVERPVFGFHRNAVLSMLEELLSLNYEHAMTKLLESDLFSVALVSFHSPFS